MLGPSKPTRPPRFVDLLDGAGDEAGAAYFDAREFRTRAWREDVHYWDLHRRQVLRQTLRHYWPQRDRRLIEIGCGAGGVTTYLNEHGFEVDYADVHRAGLQVAYERAQRRLGARADTLRFVRLDITRQLPPERYGGLLLLDVLEHLPDDRAVLQHLHSALTRDGGELVLFTLPAFQFLWSPWDDVEHHKRRYRIAQAKQLARDCGFQVLRATYFFFPLFFAALAVKTLRVGRARLFGPPPAPRFDALLEGRSNPILNGAMAAVLAPERLWLRQGNVPIGTSVLIVARPI